MYSSGFLSLSVHRSGNKRTATLCLCSSDFWDAYCKVLFLAVWQLFSALHEAASLQRFLCSHALQVAKLGAQRATYTTA